MKMKGEEAREAMTFAKQFSLTTPTAKQRRYTVRMVVTTINRRIIEQFYVTVLFLE